MSAGLSFCGLQQVKGNDGAIKYRKLNLPLFYFVGEIKLRNSVYRPFKTTYEVENVQHFKKILTEEMRSKYGFDVGIEIEGCGIESDNSGESSSKSVKYSRKDFFQYKFRPVGCFTIDTTIRRLTKNAVMDLERLKTKEDALKFLHKFGSHYPAPGNSFHYGGVEITYSSETYKEKHYTQKHTWMVYSSEEEFIRQVLSNPKHGRIITRGHDIVPVWDLIKEQYPVQADIIRETHGLKMKKSE
ncbi:hypothetical protein QYM36_019826 [Artemia franciscana]|uniref:Uncharacterized protein n=1 Tax=Artemia franciscana TaxID=6661 RepID=A0AA88H0S3_ARTSF|nr:hypothetical protein QYM36_019826 [Artemia franciscana]